MRCSFKISSRVANRIKILNKNGCQYLDYFPLRISSFYFHRAYRLILRSTLTRCRCMYIWKENYRYWLLLAGSLWVVSEIYRDVPAVDSIYFRRVARPRAFISVYGAPLEGAERDTMRPGKKSRNGAGCTVFGECSTSLKRGINRARYAAASRLIFPRPATSLSDINSRESEYGNFRLAGCFAAAGLPIRNDVNWILRMLRKIFKFMESISKCWQTPLIRVLSALMNSTSAKWSFY